MGSTNSKIKISSAHATYTHVHGPHGAVCSVREHDTLAAREKGVYRMVQGVLSVTQGRRCIFKTLSWRGDQATTMRWIAVRCI